MPTIYQKVHAENTALLKAKERFNLEEIKRFKVERTLNERNLVHIREQDILIVYKPARTLWK